MHRTAARVAAITATTAAALALAAGTATAGGDEDNRCQRADGVVVCVPADVDLSDLNLEVLTKHIEYLTPPVHLGP